MTHDQQQQQEREKIYIDEAYVKQLLNTMCKIIFNLKQCYFPSVSN